MLKLHVCITCLLSVLLICDCKHKKHLPIPLYHQRFAPMLSSRSIRLSCSIVRQRVCSGIPAQYLTGIKKHISPQWSWWHTSLRLGLFGFQYKYSLNVWLLTNGFYLSFLLAVDYSTGLANIHTDDKVVSIMVKWCT